MKKEDNTINYLNNNDYISDIEENINEFFNTTIDTDETIINKTEEATTKFKNGNLIYLNSTETSPLHDVIESEDEVLTVLSSGDFLLDAIFHGASNVLTFDINKKQLYPAQLKVKAIQHINYDDYCNFFSNGYKNTFLEKYLYNYIRESVDEDNYLFTFWDRLIEKVYNDRIIMNKELTKLKLPVDREKLIKELHKYGYNFNGLTDRTINRLICYFDEDFEYDSIFYNIMGLMGPRDNNFYLNNKRNYMKTKRKINYCNMDFIHTDINNIKDNLIDTSYLDNPDYNRFNIIYLSNIPQYLNSNDFINAIDNELMPLLKENGILVYCAQGVDSFNLNMRDKDLNELKNIQKDRNIDINELLNIQKLINSAEGFREIYKKYKTDVYYNESLDMGNGFDMNDSYVYVKKR